MWSLSKKSAWVILGLTVIAIGAVTLAPAPPNETKLPGVCLLCGTRGSADFLLNVGLFVPVGALLGLTRSRIGWSIALCIALSASIELSQLVIPGRNGNIGDLLANTAGGAIGVFLVMRVKSGPSDKPLLRRLSGVVGWGFASFVIGGTAFLLSPSYPATTYFGQWTPDLEHLDRYQGRVLNAWIGTEEVADGRLPSSASTKAALQQIQPVRIEAVAGPQPHKLASILSVYDEHQAEVLLIGADRADLVARRRLRADLLRFDRPDLRAHELLGAVVPGDTVRIRLDSRGAEPCLAIDDHMTCNVAYTPGLGWALLMYPEHLPRWVRSMLSALWLIIITLPIGLISRSRREWFLSTMGTAAVLAVVALGPTMVLPTVTEWMGFAVGTTCGRVFQPSRRRAT